MSSYVPSGLTPGPAPRPPVPKPEPGSPPPPTPPTPKPEIGSPPVPIPEAEKQAIQNLKIRCSSVLILAGIVQMATVLLYIT